MINLKQFFASIGVVTPLYSFNNQYDFYRAVLWDDGTITHNQYEFYTKIADSRYEFFKQYINETEFYKDINDAGIWDFKTFYEVSQAYFATPVNTPIPCSSPLAIQANVDVNVEDYPLLWIEGDYIDTYTGDTFQVPQCVTDGNRFEYYTVSDFDIRYKAITTNITSKLLSKYSNLDIISCMGNQITNLDVSANGSVRFLNCYNNQIQDLDLSNNGNLISLQFNSNNISTIDLSNLTELTLLNAYNNNLQEIDVSANTKLVTFNCFGNQLSELDVSPLTSLSYTLYHGNQLDNLVNSQILIDLDTNGVTNGVARGSIFGGGTLTAAGLTAKANLQGKGWTIIGI